MYSAFLQRKMFCSLPDLAMVHWVLIRNVSRNRNGRGLGEFLNRWMKSWTNLSLTAYKRKEKEDFDVLFPHAKTPAKTDSTSGSIIGRCREKYVPRIQKLLHPGRFKEGKLLLVSRIAAVAVKLEATCDDGPRVAAAPDQSWFEVAPTDPNAPRYVYADYATHAQDLLTSLIPGNYDPSLLRVRAPEATPPISQPSGYQVGDADLGAARISC
ncbi:hypothetical protein B0H17DRAFT_1132622 [Mycena rosella]|uniref:Uncharacterized protein n=1 Tax=Mycena rosella TaxID=1033263 RepID=A0AAD7DJE6_MYCRO|nr:hypothetical protein B0H17DRAFT_1132622 [Mycena rosella]